VHTTINSLRLAFLAYSSTREDIFLLKLGGDLYQWPGDLISIRLLVLTMFSAYLVSLHRGTQNKPKRMVGFLIMSLFTVQCGALIFFAQVIGSNKATLMTVSCWLGILMFVFAVSIVESRVAKKNENPSMGLFSLMSFSFFRTTIFSFLIAILIFTYIFLTNFPFEKFRIFGFGDGGLGSINSRLDLLIDGFIEQFMISPLWGHAGAEYLTQGEGMYMHNVIAYTLTHTGILGFFIATCALFAMVIEQRFKIFTTKTGPSFSSTVKGWQLRLISLILLCATFLSGVMTSSLVWGVLWFGLGLFLSLDRVRGGKLNLLAQKIKNQ
jgi:hypothetical protein